MLLGINLNMTYINSNFTDCSFYNGFLFDKDLKRDYLFLEDPFLFNYTNGMY